MKFITVEWSQEWRGFWVDPRSYLTELPKLAADMPEGAREFASDPDHYDFGSVRCIKDLKVKSISVATGGDVDLEIELGPNEWKHESRLVINYVRVSEFRLVIGNGSGSSAQCLGSVLLDEILPAKPGCSHEIACTGGVISILSADLNAGWRPCARKP